MSFSLSFVAKSRASALSKLRADSNVPSAVKAVIEQSIYTSPEGILEIETTGHINDVNSGGSGGQTVICKVRTIQVSES